MTTTTTPAEAKRPGTTGSGKLRAETIRHETRALLRAHLSAASGASGYRHLTRHCAVCHRLLRLAQEAAAAGPAGPVSGPEGAEEARTGSG
ncbi:DUF6274 family protein [Streptomyces roseoverticillatus]|uniref:DUF6274 family protein n=1 Tax=Streptomyces roseoverticillatus TaxID=66429 RepID=UPI0034039421